MRPQTEDAFKTFYFEDGFETLVPLAGFLEEKFKLEVGIGSNFLNVYTERPEILKRVERCIRRWTTMAPHVRLSNTEHPKENL
jgi:hypothetical protein